MISFKIINDILISSNDNDVQAIYMHSNKIGLYSVNINNISEKIKKNISKLREKRIYMSIKDYNELSLDKKQRLIKCEECYSDIEKIDSEKAYQEGFSFEFNCRIIDNIDINMNKSSGYYQYFIAGFLDSNKSYIIFNNYANSDYKYFILHILDLFSFKYAITNIEEDEFIVLQEPNILCKYLNKL